MLILNKIFTVMWNKFTVRHTMPSTVTQPRSRRENLAYNFATEFPYLAIFVTLIYTAGFTNAFCAKPQQLDTQVTAEVQGGSTIVGKCLDNALNTYITPLGAVKIPIENISTLEFPTNGNSSIAFLTATNGYTNSIQLLNRNVHIEAPFGKVELPVKMLLKLTVSNTVSIDYPTLTNGLLSFWNFNGIHANSYAPDGGSFSFPLQTGDDGRGAVHSGSVVSGKVGHAIGFADTGNQGLFIPSGEFPILTTFTITAWVKLNTGGNSNGESLIACSWDGFYSWNFFMDIYNGQLEGCVGISGSAPTTPATDNQVSFYDHQWHFCVFQCQDGQYIQVRVDNNAWTMLPISGSLAGATSRPFQVGQNIAQSVYNANCKIDMLGVWDRVLTESELTGLYNNGKGLEFPFTKP